MLDPLRQAEIRRFVAINKLCFIGLLETKVPEDLFESVSSTLIRGWYWISNYEFSHRGRIWVGWNPELVSYSAISISVQAVHGTLKFNSLGLSCCLSAVYREHTFARRRPLWEDLCHYSDIFQNSPWLVVGDFNAIKDPSDRIGCSTNWISYFDEFPQCLARAELVDLRYVGCRFTWSTSSGDARKMRKIDRILVNGEWNLQFSYSEANFLNPRISDHCPMTVRVLQPSYKRKPFKFFDFWTHHPKFKAIVQQAWDSPVAGVSMYQLVSKLKRVKARLRSLNREAFSDISVKVAEARDALRTAKLELQLNLASSILTQEERECRRVFVDLRSQEESFYR
ncbi:uncharacterized protein LOC120294449 [Eucalyptus grandis]|uniref:uncharacterized protein LOC120294449 n=1 Tax=Eucalyptus grandis TaxID=71139 RepID=UPI00192EC77D|nr:uncharacterized protein LOC120294449 [Eucalyptus grandis]